MIKPDYLKQGDTLGIVAPARWIEQDLYENIISIIEVQGYNVIRGKTTFLNHGIFAGRDEERLADMQEMFDNPYIKAIFCLRGGYGSIRIIENLELTGFMENPKWLIGFSDITIFHNMLNNKGVQSLHGQMPLNFAGRETNGGLAKLFKVLKGENLSYKIESNELNRLGEVRAEVVGGNVAILSSLIGTPYDINTQGKILFIEDVGEYLYRFDRLMHHLKLSGKLSHLGGLVIGGLSEMKDNDLGFGHTAEEIVAALVQEYNYPVCFGFPAGHIKENYPLIMGEFAQLKVTLTHSELIFEIP